jgi:hypothetical protein
MALASASDGCPQLAEADITSSMGASWDVGWLKLATHRHVSDHKLANLRLTAALFRPFSSHTMIA